MKGTLRKGLLYWAAAAALLSVAWASTARAHDGDDDPALRAAVEHAERSAPPGKRPIIDTHIHFFRRRGRAVCHGPRPPKGRSAVTCCRPNTPPSPRSTVSWRPGSSKQARIVEDNQWLLDLVGHDQFF